MENRTILLVEDDIDDQMFFLDALQGIEPKWACDVANNGAEALDYLKTDKPKIIFLDLNMPGMNGYDCLVKIKQSHSMIDVPVVIFSTADDKETVDRLKLLGADHYLAKPNNFLVLKNELRSLLLTA